MTTDLEEHIAGLAANLYINAKRNADISDTATR
jgi:hypothetical protein